MQPFSIPELKSDNTSMDFVVGLPKTTKGSDSIWVIMDKLTKSTHFISIRISYPLTKLVEIYISEIVNTT